MKQVWVITENVAEWVLFHNYNPPRVFKNENEAKKVYNKLEDDNDNIWFTFECVELE